jgi:hypothetical protein
LKYENGASVGRKIITTEPKEAVAYKIYAVNGLKKPSPLGKASSARLMIMI